MTKTGTGVIPGLAQHWRLYIIEGAVLVVLGAAAIFAPFLASLAFAIFLGWIFIVGGLMGLASTVMARRAPGVFWSLISALAGIAAGLLLIAWPVSGVVSLTIVLAVFLAVDGVLTILFALDHRRQLSRRWNWLLASGILDLALAALIALALPGSAFWVIGFVVGIDLLFAGFALIRMALGAHARRVP